jgi:serine protease AprX
MYVAQSLQSGLQTNPQATFDVIVQGDGSARSNQLADKVAHFAADANHSLADAATKAQHDAQDAQHHAGDSANQVAHAQSDVTSAHAKINQLNATSASYNNRQDFAHKLQDATQQYQQKAAVLAQAVAAQTQAQQAASAAAAASAQAQAAVVNLPNDILRQNIKQQFTSITGVEAKLRGDQIQQLINEGSHGGGIASISPNETVVMSGSVTPLMNKQLWPYATKTPVDWAPNTPTPPTIAVVDSGIDTTLPDFAGRVLTQVNLASLTPNSPGDGYGHGTFVAGIAAGSGAGYAGVAPKAPLVSLDVMNDQGQATVADVVKACDWILANKSTYNIKVANFSLHATNPASVMFDPLDQAVEKLWMNGVVVVAAAGNYGTAGTPSGVPFAPGNDPFVITVGAADLNHSTDPNNDTTAPWSAYGFTGDGFRKPELSAPGRYMVGPVPVNAVLKAEKPTDVVSANYMQLSGTSFAAPVVAGAAAQILASHPTWTPDQVKGALMVSASKQGKVKDGSLGVGLVNVEKARQVKNPPNPNAALDQFVTTNSSSGTSTTLFDPVAWQTAAKANPNWDSTVWSSVAWADAAWSDVAWSDAAWSDAAWASVAWGDAAWSDVAWSDAAWSDVAWADNANDPADPADAAGLSDADVAAALAAMGLVDTSCDPTVTTCPAPASSTDSTDPSTTTDPNVATTTDGTSSATTP